MKRHGMLGSLLVTLAVGAGCGGGSMDGTGMGDPNASADAAADVASGADIGTYDIQPTDGDNTVDGAGPTDDVGTTPPDNDTGVSVDDTGGMVTPPVPDSGMPGGGPGSPGGGVCPSACAVSTDCDPCWHTGEARMGNSYCCVSGLCIFRTGTCDAPPPDAGGGPGPGPGPGGTDGGVGGLDAGSGGGADAGGGGGGRDGGTGGADAGGGGRADAGGGGGTGMCTTCRRNSDCRACGLTRCTGGTCR